MNSNDMKEQLLKLKAAVEVQETGNKSH